MTPYFLKLPMNSTRVLLLLLYAFILQGCDVIENPVVPIGEYRQDLYGPPPEFELNSAPVQNVLVEDFTGTSCGYCPPGNIIASDLQEGNPNRIVAVAIHAGSLAVPFGSQYPDDFRTPEGEFYLLEQVGQDFLPNGRINRLPDATVVTSPTNWTNQVNNALLETAKVNLQMEANYVQENGHLNVHINQQWFQNATGTYNLVIMVLESGIISPQLWYNHDPTYVPDYEHNHMLRTTLTGATGAISIQNPTAGATKLFSITTDWNAAWNPENVDIVAFLTEGENGRVMNVVRQKLSE